MKKKEQKNKEKEKNIEKESKKRVFNILSIGIAVALIFSCAGAAVYFYGQYKKAVRNVAISVQDENKKIIDTIGKFMELPPEDPKIATITDTEKLKDQAFFANAQNGDKVLIYSNSKKAILYRPQNGKVIEVTSLVTKNLKDDSEDDTGNDQAQENEQNTEANPADENMSQESESNENREEIKEEVVIENLKVAVYNGTKTKGLASEIGDQIAAVSGLELIQKTNARGIYKNNLIIDLTGGHQEKVEEIKAIIGGEVGDMPEEEKRPAADLLIIGGK